MANKKISNWQEYIDMLNMSKANNKAEIASINQKAMSSVDNYRKALGLEGSGAGASINSQIGTAQAQALAQANAQNQANIESAKRNYTDSMTEAYQQLLANGSYQEAEDWRKNNVDESGLAYGTESVWDAYRTAYGNTWQNDKKYQIEALQEEINNNNLNNAQKTQASSIINRLSGATTKEEYDSLLEEYKNVLGTGGSYSNLNTDLIDNKDFDITSLPVADANKVDSDQYRYAKTIIDNADKLPNGSIVNFNYGQGNALIYVYENGKWRQISNKDFMSNLGKYYNSKNMYSYKSKKDLEALGIDTSQWK